MKCINSMQQFLSKIRSVQILLTEDDSLKIKFSDFCVEFLNGLFNRPAFGVFKYRAVFK